MYINFQQNRVIRSVKTVHTNFFEKIYKHKFATCNSNFGKPTPYRHALPRHLDRIWINSPISYCATEQQSYFHERQTDERTDERTDRHRGRQQLVFFSKNRRSY